MGFNLAFKGLIFRFEPNKGSVTYANICTAFQQHYFSVLTVHSWGPKLKSPSSP